MEQGWETLHHKLVTEHPYRKSNADSEIVVKVVLWTDS